MFDPRCTDIRTLEYIRKSMTPVQLMEAESVGIFSLLKSLKPNLHPERVVVHGKHGDYVAIRNKRNSESTTEWIGDGLPSGSRAGLARWQEKKERQRWTISKEPDLNQDRSMDSGDGDKLRVDRHAKSNPAERKISPDTIKQAAELLNNTYAQLKRDKQPFAMLASMHEEDFDEEMYSAYRQTAERFGAEATQYALVQVPAIRVAILVSKQVVVARSLAAQSSNIAIAVHRGFRNEFVYQNLQRNFGKIINDTVLRKKADFGLELERRLKNLRSRYPSEFAMHRDFALRYVQNITKRIMRDEQTPQCISREPPVIRQVLKRNAFAAVKRKMRKFPGLLSDDDLYAITGAYKPYVDPKPHRAKGSVGRANSADARSLEAPILYAEETMDEAARHVNPHQAEPEYAANCQSCVIAFEARRRGFDVEAAPPDREYFYLDSFAEIRQIAVTEELPNERQETVERQMAEWGDGARAMIEVIWKPRENHNKPDDEKGHVFIAEQKNGRTHFIEPQNPRKAGKDFFVTQYFADASSMLIMRCDNIIFSKYAKRRCQRSKPDDNA